MQEIYNETLTQIDEITETEKYESMRKNKPPIKKNTLNNLKKRIDHLHRVQTHQGKVLRNLQKQKNKTEEHSNYIPVLPPIAKDKTTTGPVDVKVTISEERESLYEEQHNSVDKRYGDHQVGDTKVSSLETKIQNLTHQLNNLESRLSNAHQKQITFELGSLQMEIANFSTNVKPDLRSEQIVKYDASIKNHEARIVLVENFLLDSIEPTATPRRHSHNVSRHLKDLQHQVEVLQKRVGNHTIRTSGEIDAMLEDLIQVREESYQHEKRIAKVNYPMRNTIMHR